MMNKDIKPLLWNMTKRFTQEENHTAEIIISHFVIFCQYINKDRALISVFLLCLNYPFGFHLYPQLPHLLTVLPEPIKPVTMLKPLAPVEIAVELHLGQRRGSLFRSSIL